MEDSPMPNKDGRTSERNKNSPSLIQQLTLLYQLEQRKVTKLQNENQSLRERISNLLSKQDDKRIGLLVADKTKRKLIQLRAITERTIKSLESGLKEFRSFVEDIDDAVEKQEHNGTLTPAKMDGNLSVLNSVIVHTPVHERLSKKFQPMLKRIPESPMIQKNLTARRRAMIHQIEEQEFDAIDKNETVEESHLFDYQQMEYSGRSCDKEQQQSMQEHSDENKVIEQENNNSHERTQIEEIVNSSSNVGGRTLEEQEEIDKEILSNTYNDSTIDETVNEDELKESKIVFKSTCNNSTIDETVNEDELIMNITMMTTASDAVAASQPRQRRAAATKVTSYKLPALNKKMRREE